MPPPRGSVNPLEGPGDYDMVPTIHEDTYPAIDPSKADLSGKAVFVTGASRGIGRSIAVSFARAGASHIAIGARSNLSATAAAMRDAATQLGKPPPTVLELELDITDHRSVSKAAEAVKQSFGRIDIIINNAGSLINGKIADENSDPDAWFMNLRINLAGPYYVMRAFIPLMLAVPGGSRTIISVASVGAHCIMPGLSGYQTSKLALLRLTEFVCAEYGSEGVLAYSVHPGNVLTDAVGGKEGVEALGMSHIFVETPELCADSLVHLASEKRDWLAGRYINVTWDLPELLAKKDEIVKGDKLKVRMVI